MTVTDVTTTTEVLTDKKGTPVEVLYFVKTADHPKVVVTRLERKSKRLVLRLEDGSLIARKATSVQVLKSHGRIQKLKVAKPAKV